MRQLINITINRDNEKAATSWNQHKNKNTNSLCSCAYMQLVIDRSRMDDFRGKRWPSAATAQIVWHLKNRIERMSFTTSWARKLKSFCLILDVLRNFHVVKCGKWIVYSTTTLHMQSFSRFRFVFLFAVHVHSLFVHLFFLSHVLPLQHSRFATMIHDANQTSPHSEHLETSNAIWRVFRRLETKPTAFHCLYFQHALGFLCS